MTAPDEVAFPPPQPRVLFVGNFWSTTRGGSNVCEALSARLREAGWTVLATSFKEPRLSRLADMVSTVWNRRREYDIAHVDVFSGHAFVWAEVVCAVLGRLGKPFVLTLHGGALPELGRRQPRRVRRLLAAAAAVTAPSGYLQDEMRRYRPDLRLHPNPLDLRRYPFRLRAQLQPRLVWVRAFHEVYNPTLAVRVLARLKPRFPEACLTMVGPDKGDGSFERTRAVAATEGVAGSVTFTGAVTREAVAVELDRHDVFLNTTNVDNAPVSVLEALASGLAIVSTKAGGIPSLIEHDRDAILVPIGDLSAMHDAVDRVLSRPDLAARLSVNARRRAEMFDWDRVLPLWEQLFRTLTRSELRRTGSAVPVASSR